MNDGLLLLGAMACGWLLVTAATPPLARMCRRFGWLDQPSPRKIHRTPTPRLTGISLFLGIWGTLAIFAWVTPGHMREFATNALPVVAGAVCVLVLGIIDDLHPLRGWWKLVGEIASGIPLWLAGLGFERLWIPFVGGVDLGWLAFPVTLFWYLSLLNAVNIIDGSDGLAVATTGVATLPVLWIAWRLGLHPIWLGAASLVGAALGFWRYNRPPARVFMGDSGALSLGYFFAVVALIAPIKRFTALAFFVPLIALFLPLVESAISFIRRLTSGKSPVRADASHLHHLLLRAGLSPRQLILVYTLVTAVFGAMCVAFYYGNRRILAPILGFFVLLLGGGLGMFLSRRLAGKSDGRKQQPSNGV